MSIFEALMLICFGLSWPVSIARSLRTRVVAGKSPGFMIIVSTGYLCGIMHKLFFAMDGLVWLYLINMLMVLTDLSLYYYFIQSGRRHANPPMGR